LDLFKCKPTEPVVVVELPASGGVHMFRDTAQNVIESYVMCADDSDGYLTWCIERSRDCDDPRTAVDYMTEDLEMWLVIDPEAAKLWERPT